jgi:diguanylate cyclase (GGDEF)-like protein
MSILTIYLLAYGVLALSHIVIQMLLAHAEYRRQLKGESLSAHTPSVTVVVPAYNEEPTLLYECLRSLDRQDYPSYEVIVVDDGSRNREELLPIGEEFSAERFRVLLGAQNLGKRHCQAVVFNEARGDVIVTVDSDTVLAVDGLQKIVRRLADPRVGAVTGNVKVSNASENFLTRLISYRYWSAFNQERAAQSLFRVVMCASGPFSAYRRLIIDRVAERYVSQRFLGEACTFGDDRHLTNLVLDLGYGVVYDIDAIAYTDVPNTLRRYLRQQVRWNKSFYREVLWTARFAHRHHPYLTADLTLQAVLPFMLLGALGTMAYQAIFIDIGHLWQYVVVLVAIGLLRASYGLFRTRSPGFLSFTIYGVIHILLLIPARLYALATIRKSHWGTRAPATADGTRGASVIAESPFAREEFEHGLAAHAGLGPGPGRGGAVLALGLNVRDVSAAYGHRAGERLVHEVAAALREQLGEAGTVSRVGVDEFGVLLPHADPEEAAAMARSLGHAVVSRALRVDGREIRIPANVGVVPLEGLEATEGDVLAQALLTMYRAKEAGAGAIAHHEPHYRHEGGAEETRWLARIRRALAEDAFQLEAQPVRHVQSNEIRQWELLLRLRQEDEIIPPGAFLALAERAGLIEDLDRWVIRKALSLLAEHSDRGASIVLEVNLSLRSISEPRFIGWLARELDPDRIHPWDLVFEIAESAARADPSAAARFADGARSLGCRFALDDFGRHGGESDALLERLLPDYVKITGDLIRHLPDSPANQRRVQTISHQARSLGHQTIAVFVGDEETVDLLRSYGIDYLQGFHVGRPAPLTQIGLAAPAARTAN